MKEYSTFYHLPEIEKCFGTINELVDMIESKTYIY